MEEGTGSTYSQGSSANTCLKAVPALGSLQLKAEAEMLRATSPARADSMSYGSILPLLVWGALRCTCSLPGRGAAELHGVAVALPQSHTR